MAHISAVIRQCVGACGFIKTLAVFVSRCEMLCTTGLHLQCWVISLGPKYYSECYCTQCSGAPEEIIQCRNFLNGINYSFAVSSQHSCSRCCNTIAVCNGQRCGSSSQRTSVNSAYQISIDSFGFEHLHLKKCSSNLLSLYSHNKYYTEMCARNDL